LPALNISAGLPGILVGINGSDSSAFSTGTLDNAGANWHPIFATKKNNSKTMISSNPNRVPISVPDQLAQEYRATRATSLKLIEPLHPEDCVIQTIPEVSPTKWHLAHATWFFEKFCMLEFFSGYGTYNQDFHFLFNSYYYTAGKMLARTERGLISRPNLAEIIDYRHHVDAAMHDLTEVITGSIKTPKQLSPKYFYDHRESELFDAICQLPEYYPTRVERSIMDRHLTEMAQLIGPRAAVIEFGAGSIYKARQLLRMLDEPASYVPVDISGEFLVAQLEKLAEEFPALSIKPVVADFTKPFDLPEHLVTPERNLVFFPGSTIGNFSRHEMMSLLENMRAEACPKGALLIGVDLIKDRDVLLAAYNDSRGVTAEFNRNALFHLNDRLGADFNPEQFRHEAVYDEANERIEMRLISQQDQSATVGNQSISFVTGERIVTEYSHKYSISGFAKLAASAGWVHQAVWTDDKSFFSVHYLRAP